MKLYRLFSIHGIAMLYQPFDYVDYAGELAKYELWHIYVPAPLESKAKAHHFQLTYGKKEDCLKDFFEMLMNLARAGKLNLYQLKSLIQLMQKKIKDEEFSTENIEEIKEWIKEANQLHDELIDELEKLDDLYEELGGHHLKNRERKLISVIFELHEKEGDDLRHRFKVTEYDEELERFLEEEKKKEKESE